MPNLKCKICGAESPPIKERHYISRDLTKTGLAAAFGSFDEPAMFDSYDCPCCGSQVIAQPHKRQFNPKSEEVTDEDLLADMSNETIAEHLGLDPIIIGHCRAAQAHSKPKKDIPYCHELLYAMHYLFGFSNCEVAALLHAPLEDVQQAIQKEKDGAFAKMMPHKIRLLITAERFENADAKLVDKTISIKPDTDVIVIDLKELLDENWQGHLLNTKSHKVFIFGGGSK